MNEMLRVCIDAAMQYYPKGTTYTVKHGQSWDAAAHEARRKEIEPLVRSVVRIMAQAYGEHSPRCSEEMYQAGALFHPKPQVCTCGFEDLLR